MAGKTKKTRPRQERGIKRRRELLKALETCLQRTTIAELSFGDVAKEAGLPLASCYHFYKNKLDLIRAYAAARTVPYCDYVYASFENEAISTWQDIIDIVVRRTIEFHSASQADLQVFFGGQVPSEARVDSRMREKQIGVFLYDAMNLYFKVPDIPDWEMVFFRTIEICRLMLALEYMENSNLSPQSVAEVGKAASGYLYHYLPLSLERQNSSKGAIRRVE